MPCEHEVRYKEAEGIPVEFGGCTICYIESLLNELEELSTQPLSTADPRSVDIIEGWEKWHRELAAIIPNLQFVERTSTRLAVEALVEKVRKLDG